MLSIEYQRDGILRNKFRVPTMEAGIVGIYVNGIPRQPEPYHVAECLPYRVRKAFLRNPQWWQDNASDVLRCDLVALDGKPLGSLFAAV